MTLLVTAGCAVVPPRSEPRTWLARYATAPHAAPRGDSDAYAYVAPPTISRDGYIRVWCDPNDDGRSDDRSPACPEAGDMYDVLVRYGIDPAIHVGQAWHETSLGRAGIGREPWRNLHGVQCHAGDGRIADAAVPWGNGCAGVYATYVAAVETWSRLLLREYVPEGRTTPETVVMKYAPPGKDGNVPSAYVASMKRMIDEARARDRARRGR